MHWLALIRMLHREGNSKKMDTLRVPDLYREISLLQLKYDNMIETCKRMLKTWPNRDSVGKPMKEKTVDVTRTEVVNKLQIGADSMPEEAEMTTGKSEPPPNESQKTNPPEMHLLDEILSQAQKIRESQPEAEENGRKKLSRSAATAGVATKSAKMAASVYKPSGKRTTQLKKTKVAPAAKSTSLKGSGTKSSSSAVSSSKRLQSSRTHAAKLKPVLSSNHPTVHSSEAVQGSQAQERLTAGGSTSLVKEPGTEFKQEQQSGIASQDKRQKRSLSEDERPTKKAAQVCSARSKVPWRDVHVDHNEKQEKSGFNIKQQGSRLTMPSKYFKLQSTLATISEDIQIAVAGSQNCAAADHFSRRLLPKETSTDFARLVQLQLAKEAYGLLKEQLLSIAPQEWAVSERSQWQEILKVKSKLDNIMEHFQSLQNELRLEDKGLQASGCAQTSNPQSQRPSPIPTRPLAYSSLKDWQAMAEYEHRQQLSAWEAELLKFCRDVVLPKAREIQCTDRCYSSVMQLLHQIVGLETKPIFLAVETAKQQRGTQ